MEEKDLPDEPGANESGGREVDPRSAKRVGFLSIYKKGQGYWTRMGTALGAALLITVSAVFAYTQAKVLLTSSFYTPQSDVGLMDEALRAVREANRLGAEKSSKLANSTAVGITAGVVLIGGFIAWRLMNKPRNVDFLIATDVEMKKVNWTSRRELFGSTRIVITFLFLIAALLFLIDLSTGAVFQLIGLLKFGPLS